MVAFATKIPPILSHAAVLGLELILGIIYKVLLSGQSFTTVPMIELPK